MADPHIPAALARYAMSGVFRGTFDSRDDDQLARASALAGDVPAELVAKTAILARRRGHGADVPAILLAHLAARDVDVMRRAFPRVIDDGRTLRTFVQVVRSGVTGRRSFGSAPKRALRAWFASRTPDAIFRQSTGRSPSMSDVIKMVRPPPRNEQGEADAVREALYGYLLGKNIDRARLPALARSYDDWKRGEGPVPDVPFEMITTGPLRGEHWRELALRLSVTQLRASLGALLRHGVLDDGKMAERIAARLSDRDENLRSAATPFAHLVTIRHLDPAMPPVVVDAVAQGLEHAMDRVPGLAGRVVLCRDVSGSMEAPLTGHRGSATSRVRCIDVAALVSAAVRRRSPGATVVPFSGGGSSCVTPLRWLNARDEAPDVVVFVSDNQSWSEYRRSAGSSSSTRGTVMAEEWERLRVRNPKARLVLVDLSPRPPSQPLTSGRDDVLHVGGFSDAAFDVIATFARGGLAGAPWLDEIEAITL